MLWKLYFGVMALLIVFGFLGMLFGKPQEVYPIADKIVLSVWMVQLVGLFGYVFRKPLLTVAIWRRLFPVFVLTLVAAVILSVYRLSLLEPISIVSGFVVMVICFALPLFPLLLANYRYAYRSADSMTTTAP
jgi:hypothetical protein